MDNVLFVMTQDGIPTAVFSSPRTAIAHLFPKGEMAVSYPHMRQEAFVNPPAAVLCLEEGRTVKVRTVATAQEAIHTWAVWPVAVL